MSEQVSNKAGNEVGSITVALPEWRRDLDRMRAKHGADSPIGHRCSSLIEILQNLPDATGDARVQLEKSLGRAIAELERLSAKAV